MGLRVFLLLPLFFFWPCPAAVMTCGGQLPNGIERPLLRSVEFLSSGSLLSCTEGDQLKFVCQRGLSSLMLWIKDAFEMNVMVHYFQGPTLRFRQILSAVSELGKKKNPNNSRARRNRVIWVAICFLKSPLCKDGVFLQPLTQNVYVWMDGGRSACLVGAATSLMCTWTFLDLSQYSMT